MTLPSRLFTFGCSFSSQRYPTWNDILGLYFDQHHNYGKGGAGNKYIFTALLSKIADGSITSKDTVVVQWSSNHRYDLYSNGRWHCHGNVMNRPDLPKELGQLWFDELASTIDTCTFATAACRILDGIGCDWYMACFHDISTPMFAESNLMDLHDGNLIRYRSDLDRWKDRWASKPIYQYCFDSGLDFKEWKKADGSTVLDTHPTPMMAYSWLRDCLMPVIGLDHSVVRSRVTEWQSRFDELTEYAQLRDAYGELGGSNMRNEYCIDGEEIEPYWTASISAVTKRLYRS